MVRIPAIGNPHQTKAGQASKGMNPTLNFHRLSRRKNKALRQADAPGSSKKIPSTVARSVS